MARTWSERIRRLLSKNGGSLEKLASDLGASFSTVLRWRHGQCKPSRMAQNLIKKMEDEIGG